LVIIPVIHDPKVKQSVLDYCHKLKQELECLSYENKSLSVIVDDRDIRGGDKKWNWVKKGIPLRVEIGPRDIQNDAFFLFRRDLSSQEKVQTNRAKMGATILSMLADMQDNLFQKAKKFQKENIKTIDDKEEFYRFFTPKNEKKPEIHGGFAHSHWCEDPKCEEMIKNDLNVTIRCIALNEEKKEGKCIACGKKSPQRAFFAKSY
jgi:prolyl-tRNA synthetase